MQTKKSKTENKKKKNIEKNENQKAKIWQTKKTNETYNTSEITLKKEYYVSNKVKKN